MSVTDDGKTQLKCLLRGPALHRLLAAHNSLGAIYQTESETGQSEFLLVTMRVLQGFIESISALIITVYLSAKLL